MTSFEKINNLERALFSLYVNNKEKLLFHGWHHIIFVRNKTLVIAKEINIDSFLVESAALVHDLNYIVRSNSEPDDGRLLREEYLEKSGYSKQEITRIEKIINEAHTATRGENISEDGKVLSDADTLFKASPITQILFTGKYIIENKTDISKLADKIVREQLPLLEKGIYFYTDFAKNKYLKWAETNLKLWQNISESLHDKDIQQMIEFSESEV